MLNIKSLSRAFQWWNPHVSIVTVADFASFLRRKVSTPLGLESSFSKYFFCEARRRSSDWISLDLNERKYQAKLSSRFGQVVNTLNFTFRDDKVSLCQVASSNLVETIEFLFLKVNMLRLIWNFFRQQSQSWALRKCIDYDSLGKNVTMRGASKKAVFELNVRR